MNFCPALLQDSCVLRRDRDATVVRDQSRSKVSRGPNRQACGAAIGVELDLDTGRFELVQKNLHFKDVLLRVGFDLQIAESQCVPVLIQRRPPVRHGSADGRREFESQSPHNLEVVAYPYFEDRKYPGGVRITLQ